MITCGLILHNFIVAEKPVHPLLQRQQAVPRQDHPGHIHLCRNAYQIGPGWSCPAVNLLFSKPGPGRTCRGIRKVQERYISEGGSHAGLAVVRKNAGGRVVDVAALPVLVRHPEVLDHLCLSRIAGFEDLTVEQALFRERSAVGVL